MSCCSQRRQALAVSTQLRAAVAMSHTALPDAAVPAAHLQRLRYVGNAPLNVRGPFSARVYEVEGPLHLIEADARDVAALLRSALFERAD